MVCQRNKTQNHDQLKTKQEKIANETNQKTNADQQIHTGTKTYVPKKQNRRETVANETKPETANPTR